MCSKILLPLIVGLVASVFASELDVFLEEQQKTFQAVLQATMSRGSARTSDVDFLACYLYYSAEDNKISSKYKDDIEGCENSADMAKSKLSEENAGIRSEFVSRSDLICSSMKECDSDEDILSFFQCYNQKGSSGSSLMYSLSSDSSDQVSMLKVQYQNIDNDKNSCNSEAHKVFVADKASSSKGYIDCINGVSTPPPMETETTAPTTESTTESPTEATTEPTTEPTTEVSTESSSASTDASTERPEEDLLKLKPMSRMNMWNFIRNARK